MILGFTGTRYGMNEKQIKAFLEFLQGYNFTTLVHGGCVGADKEAHDVFKQRGLRVEVRPGYPSANPQDTSDHFDFSDADVIYPAEPFFARNRAIVEQCSILVGAPPCNEDPGRGGTWYTIRHGLKVGLPTTILLRD